MPQISVTNTNEDLAQALKDAIQKAEDSFPAQDTRIKWKLEEVTGLHGGLEGIRNLTVTVSYAEAPNG